MIPYYGDYAEDATVYVWFNTFTSDDPSASSTITNFINTDVHIHKDGGLTQRNNAAGITVSVDYDGITGTHLIEIDTSDDTVAGFWVTGSDYMVRIEGTTVDGATVNAGVAHFSIENRFNEVDVTKILGHLLTTTGTQLADAFEKFFDVATPTGTVNSLPDAAPDAAGGLPISDAGGLDVDAMNTNVSSILTDTGTTLDNHLTDIKGTGFAKDTHSLTNIEGYADLIDDGTSGLAKIATDVAAILVDSNELQGDWTNDGRLDLIIDAIKAVTDALPNSGALTDIDTGINNLETRLTAQRGTNLDELGAANIPADIDTLLTRITAAVALASVCTEARLAELDAANLPTDISNLNDLSSADVTAAVPTAAAIATAVMAKTVDGTIDVTEALTVVLALLVAKQVDVSGSTYTFKDQAGDTKITITYGASSSTAVIA